MDKDTWNETTWPVGRLRLGVDFRLRITERTRSAPSFSFSNYRDNLYVRHFVNEKNVRVSFYSQSLDRFAPSSVNVLDARAGRHHRRSHDISTAVTKSAAAVVVGFSHMAAVNVCMGNERRTILINFISERPIVGGLRCRDDCRATRKRLTEFAGFERDGRAKQQHSRTATSAAPTYNRNNGRACMRLRQRNGETRNGGGDDGDG